jgi:hypothetical protein
MVFIWLFALISTAMFADGPENQPITMAVALNLKDH